MLPKVILHNAVSLDGKIEGFNADLGAYYGLVTRWNEGATLAGSETLLHPWEEVPPDDDQEELPLPIDPEDTRPILVTPDSRGRIRIWQYLRKQPYWKGWVALCSESTPKDYLEHLQKKAVDCIIAGRDHVDYRRGLEQLHERYGVKVVRVDSGGTLNGYLLREGLVNEISLLIHPALVGSESPKSFFHAPDGLPGDASISLRLIHLEKMQNEMVWMIYEVI